MRKFLSLLGLASLLALTGCNTVKGVGQDVQKVGSELQKAAVKTGADGH